ncbi:MAG: hypothetical protein [Circular genetic element sp.]|nr:MAG: hypothetical protein [Circular genetic element sp.]
MKQNLNDYVSIDTITQEVESWFDEHPTPFDIDCINIEREMFKFEIFFCNGLEDDFLVKITCNNARLALTLSKQLTLISTNIGIRQLLKNNKLFLLRRSKHLFQC